jgi:ubiquinone/menaquinone biosynthesis C-methylase UbiE
MSQKDAGQQQHAAIGFFDGERLELSWRYAYPPEYVPLLMEYLGAKPGMDILDVGCGSGFLSRLLLRTLEGVSVVGLDNDVKMLELANEMAKRENLPDQIEFQLGDAYQLPFPDETFDFVTSQTLL